ncbi:hypothetical protein I7I53_04892 [Histoplasma capsulatum var. duboisii H88]|uniref:Uncharacterized protein n=1 Tax=Ajellomyces capsulatus (strain H88) TaxID=544711 RepID=A0A8A1LTZ2_AJEC8|nr:hypothetical protein I7I53_04892 [Histoplasma capsulatum var. duboisii H88]
MTYHFEIIGKQITPINTLNCPCRRHIELHAMFLHRAGKIPGNGSMVLFGKFSHFCLFALDDTWTETRFVSTKG